MNQLWGDCHDYVRRRVAIGKALEKDGRLFADIPVNIDCHEALGHLYALLTVLDTKASALMRLNGVMIAAAAFLTTIHSARVTTPAVAVNDVRWMLLSAAISAVSVFLCLLVVNVSWNFLGRVVPRESKYEFTFEMISLQRIAKHRQLYYRTAWWFSMGATTIFLCELWSLTYYAWMK